jgi:hypothetical protein
MAERVDDRDRLTMPGRVAQLPGRPVGLLDADQIAAGVVAAAGDAAERVGRAQQVAVDVAQVLGAAAVGGSQCGQCVSSS